MAPLVDDRAFSDRNQLTDDQVAMILRDAEERLSTQDPAPTISCDRSFHLPQEHPSQQKALEAKEKLVVRLPQQQRTEVKVSLHHSNPNTLPSDEKAPLRGLVTHGRVRSEQCPVVQ